MIKMQGLDKLTRKMEQFSKAAKDLDGSLANVKFNPTDPASIEQAIQQLNAAVDEKVAAYGGNDWVASIADQLKEKGRSAILERAAAARLNSGEEE